jgi:hypothetical protein
MAPEITAVSKPKKRPPRAATTALFTRHNLEVMPLSFWPRNERVSFYPTRAILSIIIVLVCSRLEFVAQCEDDGRAVSRHCSRHQSREMDFWPGKILGLRYSSSAGMESSTQAPPTRRIVASSICLCPASGAPTRDSGTRPHRDHLATQSALADLRTDRWQSPSARRSLLFRKASVH